MVQIQRPFLARKNGKSSIFTYRENGSIQYTCLLYDVTSILDLIRLLCIPLANVHNSYFFMYIHDLREVTRIFHPIEPAIPAVVRMFKLMM